MPFFKNSMAVSACFPKPNKTRFPREDLYILGEYCEDPYLGRSIVIYYGSIEPVCGDLSPLELRRELRDTLRHEFRHHVEALAGETGLIWRMKLGLQIIWKKCRHTKPQRSLGRGPIKRAFGGKTFPLVVMASQIGIC